MANTIYPNENSAIDTEKISKPISMSKNKLGVLIAAVNIASKGTAKVVKIEKL